MMERIEVKFAEADVKSTGEFAGYGAVFGNVDAYGDVIQEGAFKATLSDWGQGGKLPPMLLQHGGMGLTDGDQMPIGKWTKMSEDSRGLYAEGKLINLDTERGKTVYGALKEGVLDGLSIGYRAKEFALRSKPEEPRRSLKVVDLLELSVVTFPANGKARISQIKAASEDVAGAIMWLGKAIMLHEKHMNGSASVSMASQKEMMQQMQKAYDLLSDKNVADSMGKSNDTIRDFEKFLRDVGGFSHSQAKAIAASGFKASDPRDEDEAALAAILRRNIAIISK